MTLFQYNTIKKHKLSRMGSINTAHGRIDTPAFMPVGTIGTVKAMLPESVAEIGAQIILGNTYHLMLRPGAEIVANAGGLHNFMNWNKSILTDSGGYQIMSLSKLRTITDEGVTFKSHIDGRSHFLTPEKSIEIQRLLNSDITMVLDECTPYPASYKSAMESMELSLRWAKRSKDAFTQQDGCAIFGIVQGSTYKDLRIRSAQELVNIGFDGYAIGGLSVGEIHETMLEVLDYTVQELPENKPRYLMGVGKPENILESVRRGIDMFDCVIPTRSGRNGQAYTSIGTLNIKNSRFVNDNTQLDSVCSCYVCRTYSRAYLNHLIRSKEILGSMLMTWHNLHFYQNLMARIRRLINIGIDLPERYQDLFYNS